MILIDEVKYACLECIRGHRLTLCRHHFRPLLQVRSKGRPIILSGNNQNYRVAVFAEQVADDPSSNGVAQPCDRAPVIILKTSPKQVIDIYSGRIVGPYEEEDFSKATKATLKPRPVISSDSFVANQVCCSKSLVPRPIDRVSKSCGCNRQRNPNKNTILQKFLSKKRLEEIVPMEKDTLDFGNGSRDLDFGLDQVVFLSLNKRSTKNPAQVESGDGSQIFDVFTVPGCSIDGLCCCDSKCSCPGCEKHGNFSQTDSSTSLQQDRRAHSMKPAQTHDIDLPVTVKVNASLDSLGNHPSMFLDPHAQQKTPTAGGGEQPSSLNRHNFAYSQNSMSSALNLPHAPLLSVPRDELACSSINSHDKVDYSLSSRANYPGSNLDAVSQGRPFQVTQQYRDKDGPQQLHESPHQAISHAQTQAQPPTHATTLQLLTRLLSEQPSIGPISAELEGDWARGCQCPENSCECVNCETHGNLNGYRLDDIFSYEVAQENDISHTNMLSEQTLRDMLWNDPRPNFLEEDPSDENIIHHRAVPNGTQIKSDGSCCLKKATVGLSTNLNPSNMATTPFSQCFGSNNTMPLPGTNISRSSNPSQNQHFYPAPPHAP